MHATIGDKLHVHTNHTGTPDQYGRIVEVRGTDGAPPYVVEFEDGHTRLVFPGVDAVVEPARPVGGVGEGPGHGPRRTRRVHTRVGW
jgi:uncharacterized protein DUF1918